MEITIYIILRLNVRLYIQDLQSNNESYDNTVENAQNKTQRAKHNPGRNIRNIFVL